MACSPPIELLKGRQEFIIIKKDQRPLYVQTANCVEEKEWIDLLSKICQSNKARLVNFHPRAYINSAWTCCNESDQYAPGCTPVSSSSPIQMELATALDPARDLQRLHSLIIANINSLEVLDPTTAYEDPTAARKTIKKLNEIATTLEQIHRKYKSMLARDLKYGSRLAPIGDDNYLHMPRSGFTAVAKAAASAAAAAATTPGSGTMNNGSSTANASCNTNSSSSSVVGIGSVGTLGNGGLGSVTPITVSTQHYPDASLAHFFPHRNLLMRGADGGDPLTQC
uniref:PH domain-containing protein n=1 Tax=Anopheles maculatus TaxID=74869 RepID=A0A182SKP8_9DIPT